MSASYVRTLIRQWCNEAATTTSIPFYDTINTNTKPPEKLWFTVEFTSEYHEGTFCKSGYIEEGFIRLVFVGHPGTGDQATIAAVETVVPEIDSKIDNTQRLVLTSYEPLNELTSGSADHSYRVGVVFNYRHTL